METAAWQLAPEVAAALAEGRAVVGLESALVSHGLPAPHNREVAEAMAEAVRAEGAVPAMVALRGGRPVIGAGPGTLEQLATGEVAKLSVADLPAALATGADGATTVAGTVALGVQAGITIFATGGIGGVHRRPGPHQGAADESADLHALARHRCLLVCSGVKSMLDVPATLERLETLGVGVVGYRTRRLAGFYRADAGVDLTWSVAAPAQAAGLLGAASASSAQPAVLLANPVAAEAAVDADVHDAAVAEALAAAAEAGVEGPAVTPFLLDWLHRATNGATLRANARLVVDNAALAAEVAVAAASTT